jgi:crotonobetainyl-CoA:carnitine CoA-transferase CaiB-like acyl-CoA transferase
VQKPVQEFLQSVFKARTRSEWEAWLANVDVCYAPVNTLVEGLLQEQLRERGIVRRGSDGARSFGTPILFSDEPGRSAEIGPKHGEHTAEVIASGW